jgi:hypothetical protein
MFALFKGSSQISKPYPHKLQAIIEAYERGMVYRSERRRDFMISPYSVKELIQYKASGVIGVNSKEFIKGNNNGKLL